jgi:uncharacterized protein (TIGR02145 family)
VRNGLVCVALVSIAAALASTASRVGTQSLPASKRMADGRLWTTANLAIDVAGSYCYDNAETGCRRYGRLYTWSAAQGVCRTVGDRWRLPTNDEWYRLATSYGGLLEESPERGKATYAALTFGGASGFDAVLGGGRSQDGEYQRADAHGFYWTATATGPATAWFYNFGRGLPALNRHSDGEKGRAFAVRCVKD